MLNARPPRESVQATPFRTTPRSDGQVVRRLLGAARTLGRELFSPIHIVLAGLSALLWQAGFGTEAVTTIVVVAANVVVHASQLALAEYRLAVLRHAFRAPIHVWDGERLTPCLPERIPVGATLQLQTGDRVPCPCDILEAAALQVDMSGVSGESEHAWSVVGDPLPAGAVVVHGAAWVRTTAPAGESYTSSPPLHETPSARSVRRIVVLAAALAGVIAILTIVIAHNRGSDWSTLVRQLTVVAGLVSNALVLFATLTQTQAALTSARSGVLLQRQDAAERWAGVAVVCFDKTGTLTTNTLRLASLLPLAAAAPDFADALGAFVACDGAGNQSSRALAQAFPRAPFVVVASVGFDSARKWSAVQTADATYYLGAPDILAAALLPDWRRPLAHALAGSHHRSLVLVRSSAALTPSDTLPADGVPLGVVTLADVLRPGVAALVADLHARGVRCMVVSGDDPATVQHVAAAVGIPTESAFHGAALPDLADPAFAVAVRGANIIGRVLPAQKAAVVRAWQQTGARVAFVGDGVNDIPALAAADVGIAFAAVHAAVRDSAGIVVTQPDAELLALTRQRGESTRARIRRIGMLVVTRVAAAAVVWVGTILAFLPTWAPLDSTAIALFGVGMPAVLLAILPHQTDTTPSWLCITLQGIGYGLCCLLTWWIAVAAGVGDTRWLTAGFIVGLWFCSGVLPWRAWSWRRGVVR